MSDESKGFDPYAAVLADLRQKREQIDQAIQILETLGGGLAIPSGLKPSLVASAGVSGEGPGAYLGMSIPEATKKLLLIRKQALGNAEIVAALKAGGMAMESQDAINTVGSILGRRFNTIGDIVRVGRGTWGLAEWYPGRTFKKKTRHPFENSDDPAEREVAEMLENAESDNLP